MIAVGLIADLRSRTGFSQAELARRAGMTRSVVNAYERGQREPSVQAMARLASAGGLDLHLRAAPVPDDARAGRILAQVLDLAESLPSRRRASLAYPPVHRRAA